MKNKYFKVINRATREQQVFNSDELTRFFQAEYCNETKTIHYKNQWSDYAVSYVKDETLNDIVNILIGITTVTVVVAITKIVMLWV